MQINLSINYNERSALLKAITMIEERLEAIEEKYARFNSYYAYREMERDTEYQDLKAVMKWLRVVRQKLRCEETDAQ